MIFSTLGVVWNRSQGRKLFSRSFLPLFQTCTARVNPPGANRQRKINMKLQNLIHILIGIVCFGLLPRGQAVVPPPLAGLSRLHHCGGGPRPSGSHLGRLETQQLVRFRCLASPLATSTPLLALERLILTPRIQIPQWARQRFYLTPPAQTTRPMEQPRLNITIRHREYGRRCVRAFHNNDWDSGIDNTGCRQFSAHY